MNPDTHWAHTPERSNMLMLRIMTWISLRLGRRIGRVILHFIALYFLLLSPAARRASHSYLARVMGSVGWVDMYRHFYSFASTIHDRIYLVNQRFDLFDFEISGTEQLHALIREGQGLFLLGAHLGSFEVIRAVSKLHPDLRVAMVMHEANAQKINDMLTAINPAATQDIIGLGSLGSMLTVRERLDQGYLVGMLADRTPGDDALFPVSLLGCPAQLPIGPFRMAALLRRPVLFMTGLYMGGNHYHIHFDALADFSHIAHGQRTIATEAAITRYAALLEQYCRLAPYNWFNFFDFWQTTPPRPDHDKS